MHFKRIEKLQSHGSAPDAQNINKVFHYCKRRESQRGREDGGRETDGGGKNLINVFM